MCEKVGPPMSPAIIISPLRIPSSPLDIGRLHDSTTLDVGNSVKSQSPIAFGSLSRVLE